VAEYDHQEMSDVCEAFKHIEWEVFTKIIKNELIKQESLY
jgi:hypothetical protein